MVSNPANLPITFRRFRPPTSSGFLKKKRSRRRTGSVMGRLEGVDDELMEFLERTALDHAPARRSVREAFKDIQLGIDHCLLKASYPGVRVNELYEVNSRGLEIFSKSWVPETATKAVVCFCHGYGDTCTFFFEGVARKLASSGYSVFSMDYPGFGLSEGLHGYIPSFEKLVDDVVEHFFKVKENPEFRSLPCFLFGESMGGAVALKVHLKQPQAWAGAVLVAPMCKIAENMVPPWLVTQILIGIAGLLPKLKLVPTQDLGDLAFKDPQKRKLAAYNVIAYKDKPRLGTAVEMLKVTQELGCRLEEVSLPLLILHGEADIVTDPAISKDLYEKARSLDKKICLYQDSYHAILEGESDEMIFRVLQDIVSWLDAHCIEKAST